MRSNKFCFRRMIHSAAIYPRTPTIYTLEKHDRAVKRHLDSDNILFL